MHRNDDISKEKRFQRIIETSQDAILIVNKDGRIVYANPAGAHLFGKNRSQLLDQDFGLPLARGEKEINIFSAQGQRVPVDMRVQDFEWDKEPASFVTLRDITQRKRNEQKMQDYQKFESISILAGGISHDFNNLLTSILGYIQLAQMDSRPGDPVHDNLDEALQAVERATQLTRRFIFLSKAVQIKKQTASIQNILQDVVHSFDTRDLRDLELTCAQDLWPLQFDPVLITQAVEKVLTNAVESLPGQGAIAVDVKNVHIKEEDSTWSLPIKIGRYVRVRIADTGSGISSENLPKVFDPYYSTKQRGSQKGMGLGLTTAYTIIKNHRGFLDIQSQPQQGTTVDIYLPVIREVLDGGR